MADLSTSYMGVELKSPVVVGACTLSGMVDQIKKMEAHGAGACVVKSLFEEQIMRERMELENEEGVGAEVFAESLDYFPKLEHGDAKEHLMWIEVTRKSVRMPLFASLNAVQPGSWVTYAKQLEETGVDGLELNLYAVQTDPDKSASDVEKEQMEIVERVVEQVKIPVAVKLSPFYTSVAHVATQLDARGAAGLVLFNRFLQPDIDIDTESLDNNIDLSQPQEIKLPLRWIALLDGRVKADLSASTGAHDWQAIVKFLLAGASNVQVSSALYKNGIEYLSTLNEGVSGWMDGKGYKKLSDFRGKISQQDAADPFIYERAQYVAILMGSSKIERNPKA